MVFEKILQLTLFRKLGKYVSKYEIIFVYYLCFSG